MDFNSTPIYPAPKSAVSRFFKRRLFYILGGLLLIVALSFGVNRLMWRSIDVDNTQAQIKPTPAAKSALTGEECSTATTRPFAVMVSSDAEARPLSGIGEADWVFEMPVVENGFTRMMAVFQCGRPKEVGSVRSSRLDFVPLAQGLNAIYAHFGGEHDVLAELNTGIINNIDGLKYDGTYYYRKSSIPRPHNAFTDFDRMTEVSAKLQYDMTDSKVVYQHEAKSASVGEIQPPTIFNDKFAVTWRYDRPTNAYFRTRAGQPELDKNTNTPVSVKNVLIMRTTWSPINKDYIRVKTIGSGGLLLYKNGTVITGTWEKADDKAKLTFYDQNHKEIPLVIGSTWVEVDAH